MFVQDSSLAINAISLKDVLGGGVDIDLKRIRPFKKDSTYYYSKLFKTCYRNLLGVVNNRSVEIYRIKGESLKKYTVSKGEFGQHQFFKFVSEDLIYTSSK